MVFVQKVAVLEKAYHVVLRVVLCVVLCVVLRANRL